MIGNQLFRQLSRTWIALLLMIISTVTLAGSGVKQWHTDNGIPVYFVAKHQIPMVDLAVVYTAGSARDGNAFGLASLTQQLMSRGTRLYSEETIAARLADVGAIMSTGIDRDKAVWSLRSLSRHQYLQQASRIFRSILTAPSFPEAVLTRLKNQTKVQLLADSQNPYVVAKKTLFKKLFRNHPYAHPIEGTKQTVTDITVADCEDFYDGYYVSGNAFIVIVGDLSVDRAKKLANYLLKKVAPGKAAPELPPVRNASATKVFVPMDKTQNTLMMAQMGFPPFGKDHYARLIGNDVFGGSALTSVLNDEVREKRGLAYFARSKIVRLQAGGPFVIMSQTRSGDAGKTYRVIKKTYRHFLKQGISEGNLVKTKKSLRGRILLANVTNAQQLANLESLIFYKYPLDYIQTFAKNIDAVKVPAVKSAFARLKGRHMVAVTVGEHNAFTQKVNS